MPVTNADRAELAERALATFMADTGTDAWTAIADLVCDLCHLAVRDGQDPLEQVHCGLAMYADERDFPPDGLCPPGEQAQVTITIHRQKEESN